MRTLWWDEGKVFLINQQELPKKLEYIECREPRRIASAIKNLEVRGAPAIGVAAAMALALAAYTSKASTPQELQKDLENCATLIRNTRPTAWNLFWAVDRVLKLVHSIRGTADKMREAIINEAKIIAEEDIQTNKQIGIHGAKLLKNGDVIGTICNAGWLATAGEYGTALGVIKIAHEQGKEISVIALETRPALQGARLTAFELHHDGITVTVIPDGAIGYYLSKGIIDKFICGADRIVWSSGCHVFNKIGTYTAAVVARRHNVPFYVAAPLSTFDFTHALQDIIIEERDQTEVTEIQGYRLVPEGVPAMNPAFDITPPELINAIITQKGILRPPFKYTIQVSKTSM
ncbi:S-methyl-5-thioribose-1-phosphate isomerase [Candidatus Bathyarchaeota archaeon]|nr:S-methyl-5-thioribose-1-phosphate isomerase [Candidatus Bathyarchaeota archaeon]